jgi:hypothetical protein
MAEAPKEALPHNCRPDFGAAFLTTAKFKVLYYGTSNSHLNSDVLSVLCSLFLNHQLFACPFPVHVKYLRGCNFIIIFPCRSMNHTVADTR